MRVLLLLALLTGGLALAQLQDPESPTQPEQGQPAADVSPEDFDDLEELDGMAPPPAELVRPEPPVAAEDAPPGVDETAVVDLPDDDEIDPLADLEAEVGAGTEGEDDGPGMTRFEPSERISEDRSVAFPNDI